MKELIIVVGSEEAASQSSDVIFIRPRELPEKLISSDVVKKIYSWRRTFYVSLSGTN